MYQEYGIGKREGGGLVFYWGSFDTPSCYFIQEATLAFMFSERE